MLSDLPDIPDLCNGRSGIRQRDVLFRNIRCFLIELADQDVDLGGLEAGEGNIEIEIDRQQFLQLDGQDFPVPAGKFRKAVVGDDIGADLFFRQIRKAEGRHALHLKEPGCLDATVTGDDAARPVHEDRVGKAEGLDAVGNLPDLLF